MIVCIVCKRSLPPSSFYPSVLKHRMVVRCKDCARINKQRKKIAKPCERCGGANRQKRQHRYCSRDCRIRAMTLRQYRLPPDADLVMFRDQAGLCAACREPLGSDWSRMHVDHCHDTGKVRGLLHDACNKRLEDDPDRAFWQQVYLARQTFDLRELAEA